MHLRGLLPDILQHWLFLVFCYFAQILELADQIFMKRKKKGKKEWKRERGKEIHRLVVTQTDITEVFSSVNNTALHIFQHNFPFFNSFAFFSMSFVGFIPIILWHFLLAYCIF